MAIMDFISKLFGGKADKLGDMGLNAVIEGLQKLIPDADGDDKTTINDIIVVFKDAIGKPLIVDSMTPNTPPNFWWNDFDPTVFIDDDGTPWMAWGNGTCFLVRLKPNMTELDGEIMSFHLERYVEGPWLYKRKADDGTVWWYNVYASMGRGRETISYAMAREVTGPWEYKGELTGMAESSFTIHPGVIEFKGKNYLFYHNSTLSLHGYGPATGRRSVCVDEMFYNPDGTIQPVIQTKQGVSNSAAQK